MPKTQPASDISTHSAGFKGLSSAAERTKLWARLLSHSTTGDDGCLLYTGHILKSGYGVTRDYMEFKGVRSLTVHRASWAINNPDKPFCDGMVVRHACRFKHCFAPAHLSLGTAQDNAGDRIRDGTQGSGETHHAAKITDVIAQAIFASRGTGSLAERGRRFGVHPSTISSIDNGIGLGARNHGRRGSRGNSHTTA